MPVSPSTLAATREALPSTRKQMSAVIGDGAEDGGHLPVALRLVRLADQHHHRGNRTGAGEHGDAHRDDAGIVLGGGRFGLRVGLLRGGALGLEHVQADQQKDDAAGDLERRQRDAEEPEDVRSGNGERREDDERRKRGLARGADALGAVLAFRDG
jgi:hypothetical protein